MNNKFIGISEKETPPYRSTSLLLRRTFYIKDINHIFKLEAIGLGIAVYYVNGQRITDDVLVTTFSDYSKTLYLNRYDITSFIKKGKNVIAVELGNGFYNEDLDTVWKINTCHWRGEKCLYLKLKADDLVIVKSDEKFKVLYSPFTTFNELRGAEYFDKRKYIPFESLSFDDSRWGNAVFVSNPPKGKFRENICPPVREFERFKPLKVTKTKNGYIYHFEKNISGYVEAKITNELNHEITFKYAEDINKDGELELHGLDCYHNGEPFQLDKCIADGSSFIFKPKFTYHGFRYVEVVGVEDIKDVSLEAIFTHGDIKPLDNFPKLSGVKQKLFDAGINSLLSNTYYGFTDCPTREKLNWINDLFASLPIILKYFDSEQILRKVCQDIFDSQNKEGNVPGIAPSPNWGYEYGPICGGMIIFLPYIVSKYFNDPSIFMDHISQMKIYRSFVKKNLNSEYFILGDWAGSYNHPKTPNKFVYETCMYLFDKILYEMTNEEMFKKDQNLREKHILSYKVDGQSIPSVLLVLGLGNKEENLKALVKNIESADYHMDLGVFGFQYLFKALADNNRFDLIDKIVLNEKAPSFKVWIDEGATTFYETFGETWSLSMNHHMFCNFIQYLK